MSEEHEAVFVEQIRRSWKIHSDITYAQSVDEILLGAVIAGAVEIDYSLIDLVSDGTHHYLRFENLDTNERLTFRLNHRTGDIARAKVIGHLADVTVGYGQRVENPGALWDTFKQELKSVFMMQEEPGVVTLDADLTGGFIYAQVRLIWPLEEYMRSDWQPDLGRIGHHIACNQVALRKYLQGRLNSAPGTGKKDA